ncbi:MAG: hypothetical protein KJ709_06780 [Nanoarchaeota archaeon]|nr:hypothetical protein [Nanoarchaeota archaeon]
MKHTVPVTAMLVFLFLVAQGIGLLVLQSYVDIEASEETGRTVYEDAPFDIERPPLEESSSYLFMLGAILVGTLLILLIIRFKKIRLWKVWFFMSVALCLTMAFGAFMTDLIALTLGIFLALWKVLKPNTYIHNLTELFIYAGLAAVFVPLMNLKSAFMLLVIISLYDMYAVWKSKHMISMAKFQSAAKVFAGLYLQYDKKGLITKAVPAKKGRKMRNAILGGGDIGFPLIFAGVVMKTAGWWAFLVSIGAALALTWLFWQGKKDKFYPAMPFITAGCLLGLAAVWLIL